MTNGRQTLHRLGSVTTMHPIVHLHEACSRFREVLDRLGEEYGWTMVSSAGGDVSAIHDGGIEIHLHHDRTTSSLEISSALPDGRLATIRHVLPTDLQIAMCLDAGRPKDMAALLAPMLRVCESTQARDPSEMPTDRALLFSICDRFASACLAEGHVIESIELRPWTDGMTRIVGNLPDGSTLEPCREACAALLEGWATSVEMDLSGYADHASRAKRTGLDGAAGIRVTMCTQEGMHIEGFSGDVVTAMRWAASPPAPLPLFTVRKPEPCPFWS